MTFAFPLPWWAAAVAAATVCALAWMAYRRPLIPLPIAVRGTLITLRAISLGALVVLLCRPVVERPPTSAVGTVVPIVIDTSRSMGIADADGDTRLARARRVAEQSVLPALTGRFSTEVFATGESVAVAAIDALAASGRKSDLADALSSVRERYRGRPIAGIVLISDGGDTSPREVETGMIDVPVFTIGVGAPDGIKDRELLSITADDPRIDQASVDLRVSAVSHQFGRAPFVIRLTANGRLVESRTVTPEADGAPIETVFTAFPDTQTATVYAATITAGDDEAVVENNEDRVVVSPPARRRRVLAISGAPGYEHTFLVRALAQDPALEVDAVVRQGQGEAGQDTFLIQAPADRAAVLNRGFPATRAALYAYDAVILANMDADRLSRADLELLAGFVGERGGGLLVMGGRTLAARGLAGTPVDAALPVELGDRSTPAPSVDVDRGTPAHTVILLSDGRQHPVMRIGPSIDDSSNDDLAARWAALPALASSAPLGGARPGASVLAVTMTPSGAVYPLIATQRFGRGRSMIFGGEASWRWRMQRPAEDRAYEFFWRQSLRWLAAPAPDRVTITTGNRVVPGDTLGIAVDVRNEEFVPQANATVEATLLGPGGTASTIALRPEGTTPGRFVAAQRMDVEGIHRLRVEATLATARLGAADQWISVGGVTREFADPRLNERVLSRLAEGTGGRYARAGDASSLVDAIQALSPRTAQPEWQDLWHHPLVILLMAALLSAEWMLRRRWGLR